jgi:hypothetical protein
MRPFYCIKTPFDHHLQPRVMAPCEVRHWSQSQPHHWPILGLIRGGQSGIVHPRVNASTSIVTPHRPSTSKLRNRRHLPQRLPQRPLNIPFCRGAFHMSFKILSRGLGGIAAISARMLSAQVHLQDGKMVPLPDLEPTRLWPRKLDTAGLMSHKFLRIPRMISYSSSEK